MDEFYIGQKFYYKSPKTGKFRLAQLEKIEGTTLYLKDSLGQRYKVEKYYVGISLHIYNEHYNAWHVEGNEEYLIEQDQEKVLGNTHKNSEDGAGVEREIPEFKLKK